MSVCGDPEHGFLILKCSKASWEWAGSTSTRSPSLTSSESTGHRPRSADKMCIQMSNGRGEMEATQPLCNMFEPQSDHDSHEASVHLNHHFWLITTASHMLVHALHVFLEDFRRTGHAASTSRFRPVTNRRAQRQFQLSCQSLTTCLDEPTQPHV